MHNDNYIVLSRQKQNIITLAEAKRYLRIDADDMKMILLFLLWQQQQS